MLAGPTLAPHPVHVTISSFPSFPSLPAFPSFPSFPSFLSPVLAILLKH